MNFDIFEEMSIDELERFLETGEVPVRKDVNGSLPKDTGYNKGKGETPIRDNSVPTKKGQDPLKPTKGDVEDFEDECEEHDIECKKESSEEIDADLLRLAEACKAEACKDESGCKATKKKPVEPDEIEEDNEALDENFDIDAEFDALLKEEDEELMSFDEELNDIETFLENYIDEE